MRYLKMRSIITPIFGFGILIQAVGWAWSAPSPKLASALDTKLPQFSSEAGTLSTNMYGLISAAKDFNPDFRIRFGIEYDNKDGSSRKFSVSCPAGTFREQLSILSDSAGYAWAANGDWINLIPKSRVSDPDYIMNQKIPGSISISEDPGKHTSIKQWLVDHNTTCARDVRSLRLTGVKPQPARPSGTTTLINPTLREYNNAHEAAYGQDVWTVHVQLIPATDGMQPRISLLWWGQNTTALFPPPASQK